MLAEIGLPCVIRPGFTLGGSGGGIAYNVEEFEDIAARWPRARFAEDTDRLAPWAAAAFGAGQGPGCQPIVLIGAPFQIKVWEALLQVPS